MVPRVVDCAVTHYWFLYLKTIKKKYNGFHSTCQAITIRFYSCFFAEGEVHSFCGIHHFFLRKRGVDTGNLFSKGRNQLRKYDEKQNI